MDYLRQPPSHPQVSSNQSISHCSWRLCSHLILHSYSAVAWHHLHQNSVRLMVYGIYTVLNELSTNSWGGASPCTILSETGRRFGPTSSSCVLAKLAKRTKLWPGQESKWCKMVNKRSVLFGGSLQLVSGLYSSYRWIHRDYIQWPYLSHL